MPVIDDDSDSPEYVYDDMSPVRRFYNDIYELETKAVDVVISFESLLVAQGLSFSDAQLKTIRTMIFDIENMSLDPRLARELYMLLPFEVIVPFLDGLLSVAGQKEWYEDVVNHTKSWCDDEHTQTCISDMQPDSASCKASERCPLVAMNIYLTSEVMLYDLSDAPYVLDPFATRDRVTMKMNVAKRFRLIDSVLADAQLGLYGTKFDEMFPQPTPRQTPKQHTD